MAWIDENALSLMKIRQESLRFHCEREQPPCHPECLPYRPDDLEETENPWQWGSRPGFLCTRDDAVMHSRRLEIPAVWEGRQVTGFERFGYFNSRVQELVFPEGLTEIADEAFSHAWILYDLCFPTTIRRIGDYAFANQDRLEHLILPEGLEELGKDAFGQDASLPREEPLVFSVPGSWRGSELLRTLIAPLAGEAVPYSVEYRG